MWAYVESQKEVKAKELPWLRQWAMGSAQSEMVLVRFLSARYREAATDAAAADDYVSQETLGRTVIFSGAPQTSYADSPGNRAADPNPSCSRCSIQPFSASRILFDRFSHLDSESLVYSFLSLPISAIDILSCLQ